MCSWLYLMFSMHTRFQIKLPCSLTRQAIQSLAFRRRVRGQLNWACWTMFPFRLDCLSHLSTRFTGCLWSCSAPQFFFAGEVPMQQDDNFVPISQGLPENCSTRRKQFQSTRTINDFSIRFFLMWESIGRDLLCPTLFLGQEALW